MAMDLLGGEGDGRERIFDLVGDAAGDLFPGGLLLRAEEFGGVFEDEDVAVVLVRFELASAFEQSDGGGDLERAGAARTSPSRRRRSPCGGGGGGGGRWMSRISAGMAWSRRRPTKGIWPPGSSSSERARLARTMRRSGVEGGDAVGDGFEHGFELGAAGFEGGVGGGELEVGLLGGAREDFEVGGHVVEAADEFAELFGGGWCDAAGVVAGRDGLHGVGEGFDGPGDLLGEMEREPAAGEEREAGHQEQESM